LRNHRKQRHAKLREMTRDDEDIGWWGGRRSGKRDEDEGTLCPVCAKTIRGDVDVVEAHVDSCLAHVRLLSHQTPGSRSGDVNDDMDVDVDGDGLMESATMGINFRGMGFDIPDRSQHDVEDEVDVDGEDEALFGAAQFTESDIVRLSGQSGSRDDEDEDIDVDAEDEPRPGGRAALDTATQQVGKVLEGLVAQGNVVKRRVEVVEDVKRVMEEVMGVGEVEEIELAVERARKRGDTLALIKALESKVNFMASTRVSSSTSLLCRICLDPYTEPTVSTGCWHTCCRECWLRCLGSTQMCPICKRITAAADLRRVYL